MSQKQRSEIQEQFKWNTSDLFASPEVWKSHLDDLSVEMTRVSSFKGRICSSPYSLLEFLDYDSSISKEFERVYIYASLRSDEDVSNAERQADVKAVEQHEIEYSQLSAFVRPELSQLSRDAVDDYLRQVPELNQYSMMLDRIIRQKEHTLSAAEEEILSKTSILGNPSHDAYSVFSDAEMPFPRIVLKDGAEVELDQTTFSRVRSSSVAEDRKAAFDAFWDNYKKFEGTFGELMNGNVRMAVFNAKVRKYDSALSAALSPNCIPTDVYRSLIDNVNRNLPTFHRYLRLKARLLGVERLSYADVYAPAVADVNLSYSYQEAQQLVLEAIKPLGDDYVAVVKKAFDERWIDVFPNKGKASGAYSNGAAYDVHPYILMNFDGRYDHVGTLIHELGHTMQSYLSNKNQPFAKADYSIFVAEVASTFNEALLDNLMLTKLVDKSQRISLLMNMLDGFKGTLFRQTQFAEFQLRMTECVERGEPITGSRLSDLYGEITRRYYGHDLGVCNVDSRVNLEWAYIPHFFMGFYVYQYSTSFVASQALCEMVLTGDEMARMRYMDFLAAGDSKYPIDELRDAGVDMTSAEPFDRAIVKMNSLMDQLEALL